MKVNFEMRTIELTAKEMKQASTPHTCEYKELLSVMRDLPHFEIMVSRPHITNNANRGLTYAAMEQYIAMNAAEKLDEFHTIQGLPNGSEQCSLSILARKLYMTALLLPPNID